MDEMKLRNGLLTSLISKIVTKAIKKKLNCEDAEVLIDHILITKRENGNLVLNVGVQLEASSDTITKLVTDNYLKD